jgi:hypothetical protein
MKKDTLADFKKWVCSENENDWQAKDMKKLHKKAVTFIENLLKSGVSLDDININDWDSNYCPSVYVGDKRYQRLAQNDYLLAIKHFKKLVAR